MLRRRTRGSVEPEQPVPEVLDPVHPVPEIDPHVLPADRLPAWVAPVAVGCGVAVAVLTVAVAREQPLVIDVDVALHAFAVAQRTPIDSALALSVTWAGATYVALPVLAVVGAVAPPGRTRVRDRLGAGLLLAAVASLGIYAGLLLNHVVGRARPPFEDWWGAAGGPAFPSGHTTVATVVGVLGAWMLLQRPWPRGLVVAGGAAVALAVGWSRVWLGVHWPSDVVGGWLFGAAWALGGVLVLERWRRSRTGR